MSKWIGEETSSTCEIKSIRSERIRDAMQEVMGVEVETRNLKRGGGGG